MATTVTFLQARTVGGVSYARGQAVSLPDTLARAAVVNGWASRGDADPSDNHSASARYVRPADFDDPDSAVSTKISATFAPLSRAPLTREWAFLGDSITVGTAAASAGGYYAFTGHLSGQRIIPLVNASSGGQRSDQMRPWIATHVIPSGAKTCFIMLGTNDAGQDVPLATYAGHVTGILDDLAAAGIRPVLSTVAPRADKRTLVATYNAWIKGYAESRGISVVDVNAALIDPTTGGIAAAYDSDGIHPNTSGHMVIAQTIVNQMAQLVPAGGVPLCTDPADGLNLLANPLFLTDASADGLADSWLTSGTASPTYSLVTDSVRWVGKAQKMTISGSTYRRLEQDITTGFAPGDTLAWGGVYAIENYVAPGNGLKFDRVDYVGATPTTVAVRSNLNANVSRGVWWRTWVVGPGITKIRPRVVWEFSGGSGDLLIAQATVINLTALGLA